MKKQSSGSGFSVVEAVIAMMLISIVAVSSFTAITASMRVNSRATLRFRSISLVGDCLECFKYSDDLNEYEQALAFGGKIRDVNYYVDDPIFSNTDFTIYVFTESDYKVVVTINWDEKTFKATSLNNAGELLYEFGKQTDGTVIPYTKGG